jgi:hypothetical protein
MEVRRAHRAVSYCKRPTVIVGLPDSILHDERSICKHSGWRFPAKRLKGHTCHPLRDRMGVDVEERRWNLTDPRDGVLRGVQYLILDRDPLCTAAMPRKPMGRGFAHADVIIGTVRSARYMCSR